MIWIRDISFASIGLGLGYGVSCFIEDRNIWKKTDIGFIADIICVIAGCIHFCCYNCEIVGVFIIIEGIFMILVNYEFTKGRYNKSTDFTLRLSRIECFLWMVGYIIYGICLLIGFEI